MVGRDLFGWGTEWQNLAVDSGLANAPRYELSLLCAKVEYDDGFVMIVAGQEREPLMVFVRLKRMG